MLMNLSNFIAVIIGLVIGQIIYEKCKAVILKRRLHNRVSRTYPDDWGLGSPYGDVIKALGKPVEGLTVRTSADNHVYETYQWYVDDPFGKPYHIVIRFKDGWVEKWIK